MKLKRHFPLISAALFLGVSTVAGAASSIPAQAPEVPGNAGGGPADCTQTPIDRNCVSMNPKNDSNSKASRTAGSGTSPDRATYGATGSPPQQANETPGPAGRKNDRVQ